MLVFYVKGRLCMEEGSIMSSYLKGHLINLGCFSCFLSFVGLLGLKRLDVSQVCFITHGNQSMSFSIICPSCLGKPFSPVENSTDHGDVCCATTFPQLFLSFSFLSLWHGRDSRHSVPCGRVLEHQGEQLPVGQKLYLQCHPGL